MCVCVCVCVYVTVTVTICTKFIQDRQPPLKNSHTEFHENSDKRFNSLHSVTEEQTKECGLHLRCYSLLRKEFLLKQ
jgi:hypothetical protein